MITHYLDLDLEAKGIHKDMCFYITNIGKEDIFLGYSWLAAYEPRFKWRDATIGEEVLPVIIRSINPHIPRPRPTIAWMSLECQEAALTRRTSWQRSGGGVGLGPSGKQLHPATPELTAWQERPADSLQ